MTNLPEYKIGLINNKPIRFYRYSEEVIQRRLLICPYFLDRLEVARIINKKIDTLESFINSRSSRKSVVRNSPNNRRTEKLNSPVGIPSAVVDLNPTSFEEAALYWFEFAIIGNSQALQISKSIIEKPLDKIAAEIYWKKAINDKQLQIKEAVKIAKQEETIINKSFLIDRNKETVYTLNGAIEKARIIMQLDSTADAMRIIESGVNIQHKKNQVVRLMVPVINKRVHDEIIDVANRYRFIDSNSGQMANNI